MEQGRLAGRLHNRKQLPENEALGQPVDKPGDNWQVLWIKGDDRVAAANLVDLEQSTPRSRCAKMVSLVDLEQSTPRGWREIVSLSRHHARSTLDLRVERCLGDGPRTSRAMPWRRAKDDINDTDNTAVDKTPQCGRH